MVQKLLILFAITIFNLSLQASYDEGKRIFEEKCSSCHGEYISISKLKVNFFEKKNQLFNLDTPTENMLAYAIVDSSKKIGDPEDPEMRVVEIEEFLKSYLAKPDLMNSEFNWHIPSGEHKISAEVKDTAITFLISRTSATFSSTTS